MTAFVGLRVATWNIDHARSRSRDVDRIALVDAVDADVLVLTETRDDVRPSAVGYDVVHSEPRPHCPLGERWVSIWTRLPIVEQVATRDPLRTVAVRLDRDGCEILVYGTVLPWHADVGDARSDPAPKRWAEHRRVVPEQVEEWMRLRADFPQAALVIAGDWNTDLLAGSGIAGYSYGLTEESRFLTETLQSLGLHIPTRGIEDPGPQRTFLIDHIASVGVLAGVETCPAIGADGVVLSDHPMVVVRLTEI